MAQITLSTDRSRRIFTILGVLVMLITAGAAVYVGIQLDRNQAPDDAAALDACNASSVNTVSCESGIKYQCQENPIDSGIYAWQILGACTCDVLVSCNSWGACIGGTQTCESPVLSPEGCTGGNPPITRSCTVITSPNTCTSYTCTQWGACTNGSQTCLSVSLSPTGCTGGVQPPDPYTQSCSSGTTSAGGGNTLTTGGTTSSGSGDSCDQPNNRPNGCSCNRNDKCISNYCHPTTGTCERPPECQGDNRPNGCQCSNPDRCASGVCSGGFCVGNGGGGELPDTGLFDDNGGVLIIGLGLLSLGLFSMFAGRGHRYQLYEAPQTKSHVERNTGFEASILQGKNQEESLFGGDNDFEDNVLRGKQKK